MKATITVRDEVWCYITGLNPTHVTSLWNEFGVFVDGYFFMPAYKMGNFDGKIRFFDKQGKTYVRLLERIVPTLEKWGYDIELDDHRKPQISPTVEITNKLFGDIEINGRSFELRDYQVEAVKECIAAGTGAIISGTGSGKTNITAAISYVYSTAGHKVITIVPSSDLVDQTSECYAALGLDVGVYSGSEKDINHQHIVATWQALQFNPSVMSDFNVLIFDEYHGLKAAVAGKLVNEHGKHIAFRFGVTGTFPKPEADRMSLIASIGPILKEIPAAWLIENGYLAKIEIQPVELNETYVDEEFPDYDAERAFLSKSPSRMEKIADLIVSQAGQRGNTLVLVNSIPFGEKLTSLIKGAVFLYGKSEKDLRREHYDMFETQNNLIVIASVGIASTGISINRIFCLMFVDASKGFIRSIQGLGRGLRLAHDKDSVHVVDVYSKLKWAKKHARERLKWYKEAGYPVLEKLTLKVKGN